MIPFSSQDPVRTRARKTRKEIAKKKKEAFMRRKEKQNKKQEMMFMGNITFSSKVKNTNE